MLKPYSSPKLVRLGSLRELTFGASGHVPEMMGHIRRPGPPRTSRKQLVRRTFIETLKRYLS